LIFILGIQDHLVMDAVILAAGYGSRLQPISPSKPLTMVAGKALIELSIRQAIRAGADRIIVVTGHNAKQLEAGLSDIENRLSITIDAVRVDDWSKPNGYSVIAGAALTHGPFLLLMADHVFSDAVLEDLVASHHPDAAVTLAVDRRIDNELVDPEDATWVQIDPAGRIIAIGKTLSRYDAVDCGAFLATHALVDAIEDAVAAGSAGSLSDGMQRLADQGLAHTVDIGDSWWIDVDDARAFALATEQAPFALPSIYAAAEVLERSCLAMVDD
jgi:1L-myo-inositol 1-phosphate cytidylyltransferase